MDSSPANRQGIRHGILDNPLLQCYYAGMAPERSKTCRIGIWLTLTLLAVYLLSFGGRLGSVDEFAIFSLAESIAKHGEFQINQIAWMQDTVRPPIGSIGLSGDLYAKHSLLQAIVIIPFYLIALALPRFSEVHAVLFVPPLITAATALIIYFILIRLQYRHPVAVAAALIYGAATMALPYSRTIYSEPLAGFLLSVALLALVSLGDGTARRWNLLLGLSLGLAVIAKPSNAVVSALVWAFYLGNLGVRYFESKSVAPTDLTRIARVAGRVLAQSAWGIGLWMLALAAYALYDIVRFGDPLATGYPPGERFEGELLSGLYGLLVSPGRGLIFYSPVLCLAPLGFSKLFKRDFPVACVIVLMFVSNLILFAKWHDWWGGLSWGPRFLVPVVPLLCVALGAALADWPRWPLWGKLATILLVVISLSIQMLSIVATYEPYYWSLLQTVPGNADWVTTPILSDISRTPILGQMHYLKPEYSDLMWWGQEGIDAVTVTGLGIGLLSSLAMLLHELLSPSAGRSFGIARTVVLVPLLVGWSAGTAAVGLNDQVSRPRSFAGGEVYEALDYAQAHLERGDEVLSVYPFSYPITASWYKARNPFFGFGASLPEDDKGRAMIDRLAHRGSRIWVITESNQPLERGQNTFYRLLETGSKRITMALPQLLLVEPVQPLEQPEGDEMAIFGDSIRLRAASFAKVEAQDQPTLRVQLRWSSEKSVDRNYSVFLHLVARSGERVAQSDGMPMNGRFRTADWPVSVEVVDERRLKLQSEIAEGCYEAWIGLYELESQQRLPARGKSTRHGYDAAILDVCPTSGR